jgi:hypothetical protein
MTNPTLATIGSLAQDAHNLAGSVFSIQCNNTYKYITGERHQSYFDSARTVSYALSILQDLLVTGH